MRKIVVVVLISFAHFSSSSQNIVLNPSFEDTLSCPDYTQAYLINPFIRPCVNWFIPTVSTPDYYSLVYDSSCGFTHVPSNVFGSQYPKTGFSYLGLWVYASIPNFPNYGREYISGRLSNVLISGHKYYCSFYVTPGDSCKYLTSDIGAYFTSDSVTLYDTTSYMPLWFQPQVENPQGNILNDNINWTKIDGYFFAQGGEHFIIIGCFKNDSTITLDSIPNYSLNGAAASGYYYLDDVSLVDCTATAINELNNIEFTLMQNPVKDFLRFTCNEKIERVIIYDLLGNVVLERETKHFLKEDKTDVSFLKPSVYTLVIETKDKRRGVKKFIKME